jgi:UTP--glucose-1-phosphate uridylyltransferase
MDITKVIIPAGGTSERFLPYGKTISREMLPLLLKPAIQYVAEEAVQSGLSNIIVISAQGKDYIANHFDPAATSQSTKEHDKTGVLSGFEKLGKHAQFTYIRQPEPLGLGHAIWMARHCLNKEYFAIALPDDIIFNKQPALSQLIRVARQEKASVIAVQEVPADCISNYGVIGIRKTITPNLFQLSHVVEKPHPKDAPSSLAIVGRYILSSKIVGALDEMVAYENQDIPLTEALNLLMQSNERILAYKVQGTRYDIGTPIGWIKGMIGAGLQDPELAPALRKFLADLNSPDSFLYNPAKIIENNL